MATDVGGVRELVAPETGFVVEPGDPGALVDAVIALLTSQTHVITQMTERALDVLRANHDASVTAAQFEEMLDIRK